MNRVAAKTLDTRGAQLKYCLQNIAVQAAFCPTILIVGFMLERGLSSSEAGMTYAAGNILALLIQPWIASNADSEEGFTISGMGLAGSIILALLCAAGLLVRDHLLLMAIVAAIVMVVVNVVSLVSSVSVYYQNRGAEMNFGVARSMGSVSFAVISAGLGLLAERMGPDAYMVLGIVLCIVMAGSMLLLPTPKGIPAIEGLAGPVEEDTYIEFLRKHWKFLLLIGGTSLAYLSESAVGAYPLPIMQSVGGGSAEMGFVMALQAVLELPGMISYKKLEERFRTSSLLMFSIAMFAVKGLMCCIATTVPMMYLGYSFQAISFAIYTPAIISYANRFFGEGDKNKAIGLFSLVSAVSGIIAGPLGGVVIDGFGVRAMLITITVIAFIGTAIARMGLEREKA